MEDQEKTKEELLEEINRLRLLLTEKDSKEDRRHWEQEKNRNFQKGLEAIINSSGDIIFLKDTDFRYVIANKAHETLFHVNVDDIIGKTDFDFMPEDFSMHWKSDEEALSSGEPT